MPGKKLQVRQMVKGEKYVYFKAKPLNLLGYVFCQSQAGKNFIEKAKKTSGERRDEVDSGEREWLSTLKFEMVRNLSG